jgi:hypothetical protein
MLRLHALLGGVVARESEPYVVESDSLRLDPLVAVEAGQVRDSRLNHEVPTVGQVRGHIPEAANLRLLRLQGA